MPEERALLVDVAALASATVMTALTDTDADVTEMETALASTPAASASTLMHVSRMMSVYSFTVPESVKLTTTCACALPPPPLPPPPPPLPSSPQQWKNGEQGAHSARVGSSQHWSHPSDMSTALQSISPSRPSSRSPSIELHSPDCMSAVISVTTPAKAPEESACMHGVSNWSLIIVATPSASIPHSPLSTPDSHSPLYIGNCPKMARTASHDVSTTIASRNM